MKQPKWKPQRLAVEDVREREDFQVRAGGVSAPHVNTLARAMDAEGDLEPIKVAKVGRALWVVDGFHRLEAARKLGWSHIDASVATMSAEGARELALLSNTKHGKRLGREDKARLFDQYLAQGKHLADGVVKASRVIQAELNHIWSHETIRRKLRAGGIEVDLEVEYPGGYKPQGGDPEELEDLLALELAWDARHHLDSFASLFFDLEDKGRLELLEAARKLVGQLERGERPERVDDEAAEGLLDI